MGIETDVNTLEGPPVADAAWAAFSALSMQTPTVDQIASSFPEFLKYWELISGVRSCSAWGWILDAIPVFKQYTYAIPSDQALLALTNLGAGIVEIGAGTGFWSRCLQTFGADVIAFDKNPPLQTWTAVQQGDHLEAAKYPDRALFLCYPEQDGSIQRGGDGELGMIFDTVVPFQKAGGKFVAVILPNFTNLERNVRPELSAHMAEHWTLMATISLPRMPRNKDDLRIYARKPE